jgi:hypothetical protein
MPTPVTPNEIKTLIPRFGSSMCGKFIPTITNFIRRFADFYEWMFNEDGSFTEDFKTDLCALGCTAVGLCPTLNLAPIMVGRNAAVDLTFTVSGPVPYDYELFRGTTPTGAWTSILADTGITNSTLALTDDVGNDIATAPSNGTAYYYKLVVKKAGCTDDEYITGSVTPNNCYVNGNDIALSLVQGTSSLTVKLTATGSTAIPDGTVVNVWRSTVADAIGTQIVTGGAFAGGSYTYTDAGLSVGTRYYYTVKVQQTGSCPEFVYTANSTVPGILKINTPDPDSDNNGIVVYGGGTIKFPDEYLMDSNFVVCAIAENPGVPPSGGIDVAGQLNDWPFPTTWPNPGTDNTVERVVKLAVSYDNSNLPGKWTINLLQLPENGSGSRDYWIGIWILDSTETYLPSNLRRFSFRTYGGSTTIGTATEVVTLGYAVGWKTNI